MWYICKCVAGDRTFTRIVRKRYRYLPFPLDGELENFPVLNILLSEESESYSLN